MLKKLLAALTIAILTTTNALAGTPSGRVVVRGVNSYSNCTAADLRKITAGTKLQGYEQTILDVEKRYQINAFFICAVANQETQMGLTGVGADRNNLFGMRGSDGFFYYSNAGESVESFGRCIYNLYWANGRKTLPRIAEWYCDPSWAYYVENSINYLYYKMIA